MNPGYLSFILYLMILILVITGWFSEKTDRKDRLWVWGFILAWPILNLYTISYFDEFQIRASYLLILFGAAVLWFKVAPEQQWSALTMGILLASIVYLLKEIMRMDPVLIWLGEDINILLALTIIVLLSFSSLKARLFAMTFGLASGEWLYILSNGNPYMATPILGDSSFQDLWWLHATTIVFLHHSILFVKSKVASFLVSRRRVESK